MDMANQQDNKDEREARIRILAEQFRAAEKRALLRRGVELWTGSESAILQMPSLPPSKLN